MSHQEKEKVLEKNFNHSDHLKKIMMARFSLFYIHLWRLSDDHDNDDDYQDDDDNDDYHDDSYK